MQSEPVPPPDVSHLPALDGLRGILILTVLVAHLPDGAFPPWFGHRSLSVAYAALDTFFAMSGFLITRILLSDRAANRPISRFYVRRFLRIVPPLWITIAAVQLWEPSWQNLWAALWVINFTLPFESFYYAVGHTWSLAVEEQFYLTWPWLVLKLPPEKSRWIVSRVVIPGAIVCGLLTLLAPPWFPTKVFLYMGTPYRAFSIGLGALLAFHEPLARSEQGLPWWRGALGGAAFLAVFSFVSGPLRPVVTLAAYGLLSSAILLTLLIPTFARVQSALEAAPLRYLGRISYGAYLYHLPIYYALGFRAEYASKPLMLLAMALSLGAAALSNWLVETPILRLKRLV